MRKGFSRFAYLITLATLSRAGQACAQDITPKVVAEVTQLLRGADPGTSMPIWLKDTDSPPQYLRNPAVWTAGIDLTGKAVWNSCDGRFGTTAISPLHVVYAAHVHGLYPVGTVIRFITSNNLPIERQVVRSVHIGTTDIELSTLDAPLPPSIHWYKVMPKYWFLKCERQLAGRVGGMPAIILDDNTQSVSVKDFAGFTADAYYTANSPDPLRRKFVRDLYGGDSGSPAFVLVGRELVLDGIYHWAMGGSELSTNIAALDAAMRPDGYQAVVCDIRATMIGTIARR